MTAEAKIDLDEIFESLLNIKYQFDNYYKITYLTADQFSIIGSKMSILRRNKYFENPDDYHAIMSIFTRFYKNFTKRKNLIAIEPRLMAQKFIGKKKIRKFIFTRDGFSCLKCGSKHKLQLDHINPISRGGENKISNLQTLCNSCNSIKRDTYFDYRNKLKKHG